MFKELLSSDIVKYGTMWQYGTMWFMFYHYITLKLKTFLHTVTSAADSILKRFFMEVLNRNLDLSDLTILVDQSTANQNTQPYKCIIILCTIHCSQRLYIAFYLRIYIALMRTIVSRFIFDLFREGNIRLIETTWSQIELLPVITS